MRNRIIYRAWLLFICTMGAGGGVALSTDELTVVTTPKRLLSTVSERDRLYAELAADVAELEQRGSALKRVVKLATPAVVHIEARRDHDGVRPAKGESEEAG